MARSVGHVMDVRVVNGLSLPDGQTVGDMPGTTVEFPAAVLNAQNALRVQLEKADGTDVDPTPAGAAAKSGSVPVTLATDDTIVPTAVAHGANPTAVAAAAQVNPKANRAGIPFVIGGHPNIVARSNRILAADGALTNAALSPALSAGTKMIVTQISIKADKSNSGNQAVLIGFGATTVPTPTLAGTAGIIFDEDVGAGEGHQIGSASGIVGIGADGEELRITCDAATGGSLTVSYSYYTIES